MAQNDPSPDAPKKATERPADMKEMLSGPALYANRMYASNLALGMRVTFLEAGENEPDRYRTAVFLTWPDAIALRDLLTAQLAKIEVAFAPQPETPEGDVAAE